MSGIRIYKCPYCGGVARAIYRDQSNNILAECLRCSFTTEIHAVVNEMKKDE